MASIDNIELSPDEVDMAYELGIEDYIEDIDSVQ